MPVLLVDCPDGELPEYFSRLVATAEACMGATAATRTVMLLGKCVPERLADRLRAFAKTEFSWCEVTADRDEIIDIAQAVLVGLNGLMIHSGPEIILAAERSFAGQVLSLLSGMTLSGLVRNVQEIRMLEVRDQRVFRCRNAAARVVYDMEILTPLMLATVDVGMVADAGMIVAGGGAFTSEDAYQNFVSSVAEEMHALCLASRGAVDMGAVARDKVVGLSARQVIADTYLSLGISGAPQHMFGVQSCDFVAAVNLDPDAPIFRYADIGLVADVTEFVEQLHVIVKSDHG
ncbi:MAG: FAD-binding protein [bacterium]|nr:FAD-binding protein [bacterium]